jgi:hypothetical protein
VYFDEPAEHNAELQIICVLSTAHSQDLIKVYIIAASFLLPREALLPMKFSAYAERSRSHSTAAAHQLSRIATAG